MNSELDIFQKVGVSVDDLARWLDVTKQAVTKGFEAGHYLTRRRVQVIFSRLLMENPSAAHALRRELLSFPELDIRDETIFDVVSVDAIRDRTLDEGFQYRPRAAREMWIASAQPRELQPDNYLERRAAELFSKQFRDYRRIAPLNRIVYFSPPAAARDLALVLRRTFESIPLRSRTDVKIVASAAFSYSAGYTIFDPYQQGQRGWFTVDSGDLYVPMPHAQLSQVASALRVAGVACWQPNRAQRRSYLDRFIDEQSAFEVLQWGVGEQNIPQAKKKAAAAPGRGETESDQPDPPMEVVWNPPLFVGGGIRTGGNSAPELSLVFDSLAMQHGQHDLQPELVSNALKV